MDKYSFQFCPKLVVFSKNFRQVLIARRMGESDYNGTFSFIGGKMERTDQDIADGIAREKREEMGDCCKVSLYPQISSSLLFRKKDGSCMITSHYFAVFEEGEIVLNPAEYAEYKWVDVDKLDTVTPIIPTIPSVVELFLKIKDKVLAEESIVI